MNELSQPFVGRGPVRLSEEGEFRLGNLTVRPSLREVCWADAREQLEPRVMQVLVALAHAQGSVVSRDELIRQCWEGRIVGEAAINRCILKLRDLAETAGSEPFRIETIPRVGYRLLADGAATTTEPRPTEPQALAAPGRSGYVRSALAAGLGNPRARRRCSRRLRVRLQQAPGHRIPGSGAAPACEAVHRGFAVRESQFGQRHRVSRRGYPGRDIDPPCQIGSLKVISRTFADQYENKSVGIREIARRLGVANILEGSVQQAGDKIRINVQLIRAASDDHLWAEDYDRTLEDVLSVESDVANAIATALAARMTSGERKEIIIPPAANPHAYDSFLRALVFAHKSDDVSLHAAIQLLDQAVQADPKFALAWAWLARMQAYIHFGDNISAVRSGPLTRRSPKL
jgi:DNA-binding winged helix-turn-helix (wHTH) protein